MKKADKQKVIEILANLYPEAKPALIYSTPFELLVAVILSAQCTDERVNKVTKVLFEKYNTPQAICSLSQTELEGYVFSCGLYRSKAAHILSAARDILDKFDGEVPRTVKELMSLAGVGKKTANVVYSVAFHGDAIAVDTHVFRVSNRLGIAKGKTPKEVEKGLNEAIKRSDWSKAHHYLIYHGRQVCHARAPRCESCALAPYCEAYKKTE